MKDKFLDMIREMIKEPVIVTEEIMDLWWAAGELPTKVLIDRKVRIEKFYQDNLVELSSSQNIGTKQEIEELIQKFKDKISSRNNSN